ncbi:MAG TPA: DUF6804 family protein [Pseudolysinimonas sp.]|nr:DUF6804 family protein [Pseudolysinimonas sp.]
MSNRGTARGGSDNRDRYGAPTVRRLALAPGLLAAIVLIAGFALIEGAGFIIIRYLVAILALIVGYFAFQAKQWWWMPLLLAIAVIWNPVIPLGFSGISWYGAQYVAIVVFLLTAIFIKVPLTDAEKPGRAR